jgi:putative glutamine amidotransferase
MTQAKVAVARWRDVPGERLTRYWERLREADLEPLDCEPGRSLDTCAGLLLTGGIDIDPARYGEVPDARVNEVSAERDEFEAGLLHLALQRDMPVLAICRGHQLLNVCLGGSLLQHIAGGEHEAYQQEGYPSRMHRISVHADTKLAPILGKGSLVVNSRHHQAVTPDRLAPGLCVAATEAGGIVEAVESVRHAWVIGVQWHPERTEGDEAFDASSRRLFAAFAAAARRS